MNSTGAQDEARSFLVRPGVRASTRGGTFAIRSRARTGVADEGELPDGPASSDLVMLGSSLLAAAARIRCLTR